MNPIDKFLNNITMYRLIMYGLLLLVAYSLILSFIGQLAYSPLELILLFLTLTFSCYFGNIALARIFKATTNSESSVITSLILYFLLWPSTEWKNILIFAFAGTIAMASKYVFAYKKKHIFNPAAVGAISILFLGSGALWWVATSLMLPLVLILGLLIVRKLRRFTMFSTFILMSLLVFILHSLLSNLNIVDQLFLFATSFPVIFFGTIMLTEPLTTPPTRRSQIIYAMIVGFLFSWQGALGPVHLSPELALIMGNIFSFIVSPKQKLFLHLLYAKEIARDTFEFSFSKPPSFNFKPGQYLEWTLPLKKVDNRGNRRYFTVASSPTEDQIKLGIRLNNPSSIFKSKLVSLKQLDTIVAGQLAGEFVMPENQSKKLVFIAGGIGVTPFRSMIKWLVDRNEKRNIVFFYSNKNFKEIAYKDEFDNANDLGVSMVYLLSDEKDFPKNWKGEIGRVNEALIKKYAPDFQSRHFYISGPSSMVTSYKKLILTLGVKRNSITTDFFPGF